MKSKRSEVKELTNTDAGGKNQVKERDSQQDLTIITLNLILKHRYAQGNDLFVWYTIT